MTLEIREIYYRLPGRVGGVHPGAHRGTQAGLGTLFYGVTDFLHHPDLRRLELRRSFLDPYRRLHVRMFEQRSAATVVVAADLSASMTAGGDKLQQVATLTQGLAAGARRLGDRFGFIGFDRRVRRDWVMPPLTATGWVPDWCRRLLVDACPGKGATGALELANWLPANRTLVVLISDFHWPDLLIRQTLTRLGRHWVVPVVLWRWAEVEGWPRWGLRRVNDAETGRERLVWLRPGWRRQLQDRYRERRQVLQRLFLAAGFPPLWLEDGVDPQAVARYFEALGA